MRNILNSRILITILIPILLIPLAGFTYAHLTDAVIKRYKLHVDCGEVNIESDKVYSPWDYDRYLVDDTFIILATGFPGWYGWVGLVIKNDGIYAMNVAEPTYQVIVTPAASVIWNASEFYYGPYTARSFNQAVWRDITGSNYQDKLDTEEGVIGVESEDPSVCVEPPPARTNECRLIVWIYLSTLDGPDSFEIEISITISATMANPLVEGHGP